MSAIKAPACQVRWLASQADMNEMLENEQASYTSPWTEEDYRTQLRERNCVGIVAERDGTIVGQAIYTLHKTRFQIVNLVVHPHRRRNGYAHALVEKITSNLSGHRKMVVMEVRESNLAAQQFLKAMGFRCTQTYHEHYEDTGEDAYKFVYHKDGFHDGDLVPARG